RQPRAPRWARFRRASGRRQYRISYWKLIGLFILTAMRLIRLGGLVAQDLCIVGGAGKHDHDLILLRQIQHASHPLIEEVWIEASAAETLDAILELFALRGDRVGQSVRL